MSWYSRVPHHPTQSQNTKATVTWSILPEIDIAVCCVFESQLDEKFMCWCFGTDSKWDTFSMGKIEAQLNQLGTDSFPLGGWLHTHVDNLCTAY